MNEMNSSTKFLFASLMTSFALMASIGGTSAKPLIVVKNQTYHIVGSSVAELRSQMDKKGPKGMWGYTSWRYFLSKRGCRVKVEIVYTQPVWTNKSKGSKSLQKKWNKFKSALKAHEKGHGEHAIFAGREIEKNGCRNSKQIADKWGRQDKKYDNATDHGTNTGVRLR